MKKNIKTTKTTKSKTTYKPIKPEIQIQYNFHDVSVDDIEQLVTDHLVELGYKKTNILALDIYYKAELNEIYYIAKTKDNQILSNKEPLFI